MRRDEFSESQEYGAAPKTSFMITWDDSTRQGFQRLEMLKLMLENGHPRLLSLAAQPINSHNTSLTIASLHPQVENQP